MFYVVRLFLNWISTSRNEVKAWTTTTNIENLHQHSKQKQNKNVKFGEIYLRFAPLVLQRNRLPLHVVKGPTVTYGFKLNLQHCAHVACLANQVKDDCRLG